MKKQISLLICLAMLVSLLAGCGAAQSPAPIEETAAPIEETAAPTEEPIVPTEDPAEPVEETAAPAEGPDEAPEEPAGTEEPEPTAESGLDDEPEPETEIGAHYVFQPKVCSSAMTEVCGEHMTETWFSLVDAIMAGEETFACPDEDTYWWVMGQYPDQCFPVLKELIWYCYDVEHPVKDGVAEFTYTVPKEEAKAIASVLVESGIKAIWNFAHVDLNVPAGVQVENVHLSDSLMKLSYNISNSANP